MAAPAWASALVERVLTDHGIAPVDLTWRRSRDSFYTSGSARRDRIVITAGHHRPDALIVLLHELAHVLAPEDEHHGPEFWRIAWDLFDRYAPNVPRRYILDREGSYRRGALTEALRRGVRGTAAALRRIEHIHVPVSRVSPLGRGDRMLVLSRCACGFERREIMVRAT